MPLYEYECKKCGTHYERIEKLNGPHMRKCAKCGGSLARTVTAPAIHFKGPGWYVTDYAGKTASADSEKSESADSGKTEGKEKKETKTESVGAEKGSEKSAEKSTEKSTEKKAKGSAKEK